MLQLSDFYGSSTGSGLTWSVVTVDTTGVNGNGYMFNNSSAIHTLTLPTTPPVGATIGYKDLNGYFASFPLTVSAGSEKINGLSESMVVDTNNAYGMLTYSGTSNGWILTNASVGPPVVGKPMMHVQDQKPSGTGGGASIAGTQTRILNIVLVNDIAGASLGANQITLPAGEYWIECDTPAHYNNIHKARLYNVTTSTYIAEGTGEYDSGGFSVDVQTRSFIRFRLSLSATNILRIDHYTQSAGANYLGYPSSQGTEVYTDLRIYKLDSDRIYNPRVFQPINQPVTGAYVTGGIWGGELNYVNTTQFSVNAFSCMADDSTTALFINSTTTVTITSPVLNTIYNVFAVKFNTGLFGILYDTDINGANLGATVVAKRWLGFVRTNASAQICNFTMSEDVILFNKASDNVLMTGISTSYVTVNHSTLLPASRISHIQYGSSGSSATCILYASDDGTNVSFCVGMSTTPVQADTTYDVWGLVANTITDMYPFLSSRQFKSSQSGTNILCHKVKVRR